MSICLPTNSTPGEAARFSLSPSNRRSLKQGLVAVVTVATLWVILPFGQATRSLPTLLSASQSSLTTPQLSVHGEGVQREQGYLTVLGEVTNRSTNLQQNVEAVAEFFDREGHLLKVESVLVEFPTLRAGEESPFRIQTQDAAGIESCRVRFRHLLGSTIPSSN